MLPLEDEATAALSEWNTPFYERVAQARASPLFETPIAHFSVRAYLSDGVDEVLGQPCPSCVSN